MFTGRLCSVVVRQRVFCLERTGSGPGCLNIISVAHAAHPAGTVRDPDSNSTIGEVGVQAGVERAGADAAGFSSRAAPSHVRRRRDTYWRLLYNAPFGRRSRGERLCEVFIGPISR